MERKHQFFVQSSNPGESSAVTLYTAWDSAWPFPNRKSLDMLNSSHFVCFMSMFPIYLPTCFLSINHCLKTLYVPQTLLSNPIIHSILANYNKPRTCLTAFSLSIFQDDQPILIALIRNTAANLNPKLLHPISLWVNLRHILSAFCYICVCFYSPDSHYIIQIYIFRHQTAIPLESYHNIKHPR